MYPVTPAKAGVHLDGVGKRRLESWKVKRDFWEKRPRNKADMSTFQHFTGWPLNIKAAGR